MLRDSLFAVMRAGNLTAHCRRGVRVVAEVRGHEDCVFEAGRACESPQSRLQTRHYVARTSNHLLRLRPVGPTRDFPDRLAREGRAGIAQKDILLGTSQKATANDFGEEPARVNALLCAMRRPRAFGREMLDSVKVWKEAHGDRGEPHDAAIAGRVRIGGSRVRVSLTLIFPESRSDSVADVEAAPDAAQIALLCPAAVAVHLI